MTLRAIIFDFDGVIVDSEPAHFRAFQEALAEHGIHLPEDAYYGDYLGLDDYGAVRAGLAGAGRRADDATVQAVVDRKVKRFAELMETEIRVLPGVAEFVRQAARRWPLAICSGAMRHEIDHMIEKAGLSGFFQVIVSAADVQRCKPDPQGYLLTISRLNARLGLDPPLGPRDVLVIEDSLPGVEAARNAGTWVLANTTAHRPEDLGLADLVVDSIEQVPVDRLEAMLKP